MRYAYLTGEVLIRSNGTPWRQQLDAVYRAVGLTRDDFLGAGGRTNPDESARPRLRPPDRLGPAKERVDYNGAEQVLRPIVLGRRNWLFAGSAAAAHRTAILYSLVQTCKHLQINPFITTCATSSSVSQPIRRGWSWS